MSSQSSDSRASVSFNPEIRFHLLSPRGSPEPDLEEQMPPATNGVQQAGAYGIPVVLSFEPQYYMPAPAVHPTFPSFPVPPTPLLPTVELPPSPSLPAALGGPAGLAHPLPANRNSSVPTLRRSDELALLQSLPIVWRLEQRWDVRELGLPLTLPTDERIPALCGVPEVVLHFTPHPLFAPFTYIHIVEPNVEGKFVVTVGELARTIQAAIREPLGAGPGGRLSDEQRAVLDAAQRYHRFGRGSPGEYYRVDMWGPGRMFLRHLVSLSSADSEEEGLRREFAVQFQLI